MSLIYDALRQNGTASPQATATPVARARGGGRRTGYLWLGATGSVLLGYALVHALSGNAAPPVATTATRAPLAAPAAAPATASVAAPVAVAAPAPVAAAAPIPPLPPLGPRAATRTSAAPVAGSDVPAPATPAPRLATTPSGQEVVHVQSQQMNITVSTRRPARDAAPAADTSARIPDALASLQRAVVQGDAATIEQQLQALRQLLPADSLTLLRNEAWVAHNRGDLVTAEDRYRQILSRVPEDTQAGVNLALLEAGRGQTDVAQGRLLRLAAENGDSSIIAQALAQIRGTPQ
ncbi:tetratricopeptide repeat protein [Stenotrophomonas sp. STM01]|uniref:tetratricopeptide repeat protein n=1 Tax=Stenotrophomonas sp. STM01 TaxID=2769278 RepID=UPI00177FEB4A|nr:tetratricopeptide repeat protein [Stenotrophomonas sp. STM01]MBD9536557.1 tetratricopeptide repeat protein [Stenotrophomonas sp. STM01]